MDKIKIGIIGCGKISRYGNAPGYLECENTEILAVCDSIEARAKECKHLWRAKRFYTDYNDLLEDDEIDAVDICVPHNLHAELTIAAAEAGKHVAVQKPMAMNVTECNAMIKAAKKAGVKLMLEECELFYPPYIKTKELIEAGRIGEPKLIQIGLQMGFQPLEVLEKRQLKTHEGEAPYGFWRDSREQRGGFLFDVGWHKYALAYNLFGNIEKVDAWIDDFESEMPSTIMWKHENSKNGIMSAIRTPEMYAPCEPVGAPLPAIVEIIGSKGIIMVTQSEGQTIRTGPVILYDGDYPGKTTYYENIDADYSSGFKGMTKHFIECILENKTPILTGEDGKKILKFALAIYESAKKEKTVYPSSIKNWSWKDI